MKDSFQGHTSPQEDEAGIARRVWKIKEAIFLMPLHVAAYLLREIPRESREEAIGFLKEGAVRYCAIKMHVKIPVVKIVCKLENGGVCVNACMTICPDAPYPMREFTCDNSEAFPGVENALSLVSYWYLLTGSVSLKDDMCLVPELEEALLNEQITDIDEVIPDVLPMRRPPDSSPNALAFLGYVDHLIDSLTMGQVDEIISMFRQSMTFIFCVHDTPQYYTLFANGMLIQDGSELHVQAIVELDHDPCEGNEGIKATYICSSPECEGDRCVHKLAALVAASWYIRTGEDDLRTVLEEQPEFIEELHEFVE